MLWLWIFFGWFVLFDFVFMGYGFFAMLGLAYLHTTHNFIGMILNFSPLEYKYNLSQNMLQVEASVFQLVELLWINGQHMTQGTKSTCFFLGSFHLWNNPC